MPSRRTTTLQLAAGFLLSALAIQAQTPAISPAGVVNAASFKPPQRVAPGSILSIFGTDLSAFTQSAGSTPLPADLGGATLRFNGSQPVPLFFSSPNQINAQVPWELTGQSSATLTDRVGFQVGPGVTANVVTFAPAIFTTNQTGAGQAAIHITGAGMLAAPQNTVPGVSSRPAVSGDFLEIYATGLGPVTNQPASGHAALANPLSETTTLPTVTVGGVPFPVTYSGLAPGFVGLYQINVQVPPNLPPDARGSRVPVRLEIGGQVANIATVALDPPPSPGVVQAISVDSTGTPVDCQSLWSAISGDGRYVAFNCLPDLVLPPGQDTNMRADIFLRDTCLGAAPAGCTPSTTRVSVADPAYGDANPNNPSLQTTISENGRYIAFASFASNLLPPGTDEASFFVRDTCIGAPAQCTPSTAAGGVSRGGYESLFSFSADGRYLAYQGPAPPDPSQNNNLDSDVYVRDTCNGSAPPACEPSVVRASVPVGPSLPGVNAAQSVAISADGRFVAFWSTRANLVQSPPDNNAVSDVFARDLVSNTTELISVTADGNFPQYELIRNGPLSISANGRYVLFDSGADDLVANDLNGNYGDVFLRDRQTGTTTIVSLTDSGIQLADSGFVSCGNSADMRFVCFSSNFPLVADDTNGTEDTYVRDTCIGAPTGCTPSTVLVSLASDGAQANGGQSGLFATMSADGRYVLFYSLATNLIAGETNPPLVLYIARTGK